MAIPKIKKTVYCIRHPEVVGMEGKCYGQFDAPFDESFKNEIHLSELKKELPPQLMVYSSPLKRCKALAQELSDEFHLDSRLAEISFGNWENKLWDQIPRKSIDEWAKSPHHFCPPGGESFLSFRKRVQNFLDNLIFPNNLLITHSGVIKCLYHLIEGNSLEVIMGKKIPFLSLHQFKISYRQKDEKDAARGV